MRGLPALRLAAILIAAPALAQHTERSSVATGGAQGNGPCQRPAISWHGRYVVFDAFASNLAGDASPGVMLRDRELGTTVRVDVAWNGGPPAGPVGSVYGPTISGEGRFVGFESRATNLIPVDVNTNWDVFVRDMLAGTTTCASVNSSGVQANGGCLRISLSVDGRFVAYGSDATNLVADDTNGDVDVFVRDLQLGLTTRVSVASGGAQVSGDSEAPAISADGRYVAFQSFSSGLVPGDTNGVVDVFVHDRATGETLRASVAPDGTQGGSGSGDPSISSDGRFVAFQSGAPALIPGGGSNLFFDVLVRDMTTGSIVLASASEAGVEGNESSWYPSISPDGRFVAFGSGASNLVPGDTNGDSDVFVRDLATGTIVRANLDDTGRQVDGFATKPSLALGAEHVAFYATSTAMVGGDTNGADDVFVRSAGETAATFCFGDLTGATCPCGNDGDLDHGCQNSASTGGGLLASSGTTSPDTVGLHASYELATSLTIFLQSDTTIAPVAFGDGLRCLGGALRRLYSKSAVTGSASAPGPADPSVTARSAALGDPIPSGGVRHYMAYYRDANASFCPAPSGSTFNATNALTISW